MRVHVSNIRACTLFWTFPDDFGFRRFGLVRSVGRDAWVGRGPLLIGRGLVIKVNVMREVHVTKMWN